MLVLDDHGAEVVRSVCDVLVPGNARVGPEVYIDSSLELSATAAAAAA
jgi:hypothetical protein